MNSGLSGWSCISCGQALSGPQEGQEHQETGECRGSFYIEGQDKMNTAVVFYIDEQWLQGDDNPWGVRYDGQILPHGSVVVGFMKWDAETNSVQELLDAPVMTENQEQLWNEIVEDTRSILSARLDWLAPTTTTQSQN